jgi:RNA-directed DNA polymerase
MMKKQTQLTGLNPNMMWKFKGLVGLDIQMLAIGIRYSSTMTGGNPKNDWHNIDWNKVEAKVKDLQEKIVIATLNDNKKEIYKLQWNLLQSFEAQALAIRKVVTNKGGKTPGVDSIAWEDPKDYWNAIIELANIVKNPEKYKAQPLRRVYIPKGNTGQMRPLGIPTMIDRAVQAIYHFGIDPVVETQSDPNSFGFRKHRSTHDAITAIRSLLDKKSCPKWILEADISKCFDKIDHDFLLRHTPICHKSVLKQWLKCGVMEELNYMSTEEGTPQGGIISPTLCNIALNGIEEKIKQANPSIKGISAGVHVIRYADDMIITGKTQEMAIKNKELLSTFLKERGLELNETKTLITHIKDGFDFLGFNIKRNEWNSKLNNPSDQDTILIIKPSKKGISKLKESISKIITMNKPLIKIITDLNPVLRGWGEHKRISYHSQETFISIDHWIYIKMKKWVHWKGGSLRENMKKYLQSSETRKWNWGISLKEKLINLGEIPIIQLRPLKLDRNPYLLENIEYFNKRKARMVEAKFRAAIYKKFNQVCPICEESLHNGELVELHHIVTQKSKGKYSMTNILPLHQICHQQVTYGNQTLERLSIARPNLSKLNQTGDK